MEEPLRDSHRDEEARELDAFKRAQARATTKCGHATLTQGMLVLANTMLGGSGLLAIPHAFSGSGFLIGSVLILVFGSASAFGCHLLQCCVRKLGVAPASFGTAAAAVAPNLDWVINSAVLVKCFGVGTSYLIIVGDLAPSALAFLGLPHLQRWEAVLGGFVVGGALCLPENLSALRYTSTLSVIIVLWTCIMIALFFVGIGDAFDPCGHVYGFGGFLPVDRPCNGSEFDPTKPGRGGVGFVKALPVFIFAFTCHQNVFTVCNEVKEPSRGRLNQVIAAAYVTAGAVFSSAAMLGYATYGDSVESNLLKGYPLSPVVEVTRLFYSLLAVFSYPMQIHPARKAALEIWSARVARGSGSSREPALQVRAAASLQSDEGELAAQRRRARGQFLLVTALILAGSGAVGLTVSDLGIVLGVVGATGSTLVTYILPGILYVRAFPRDHAKWTLACCQLSAGFVIAPICLFALLAL